MGVSAEWQISGETHASDPQKVAVLRGVRGTSVAGLMPMRQRKRFIQQLVQSHKQVAYGVMSRCCHFIRGGKVLANVLQHRVLEACPL